MAFILNHIIDQAIVNTLKIDGEYRARFERRIDKDFNSASDNRTDLMHRVRLSAKVGPKEGWSGTVQYQYAYDEYWTAPHIGSDESGDLIQLFAQHNKADQKVTVGRQRINVGSERLIGSLDWVNHSRSFDGVRFQNKNLDVFAAAIGVQNARPKDVRVYGATYSKGAQSTSLIYKHDGSAADVDITTLAQSCKLKTRGVEFDSEAAYQLGSIGTKDQDAWALHIGATRQLGVHDKATLEFNAASGGSSASKNHTFDNLYPTNHKFYGLLDMFAWKNMSQIAVTINHNVRKGNDLKFRVSRNWLRDSKDAWYGAGGGANTRAGGVMKDATGASGRDLGYEFDAESTWVISPKQTLSAGLGIYAPGNFVKNLTGQRKNQTFGYVQYIIKF